MKCDTMHPSFEDERYLEQLAKRYEQTNGQGFFFEETEYEDLIDFYESRLMLDRAMQVVEEALVYYPFTPVFALRKAEILVAGGEPLAALELLGNGEALYSGELEYYTTRAGALAALQRVREAMAVLDEAFDRLPPEDHDQLHLAKADLYEDQERYDEVMDCLRSALLLNPRNEEALHRIWYTTELTERYEESIRLHQGILNRDPYAALAWYNLGHAQSRLEQFEEAIESFEYAIVIDEKFLHAYRECAEAYFFLGDYQGALDCLLEGKPHVQPDAEFQIVTGRCYEALGDRAKAREYYLLALRLDPQHGGAFYQLGLCYAAEEKWQTALSSFRKALRYEADNADYHLAAAEACYHLEEFERVYEYCNSALETEPAYVTAWVHFSCYLILLGDLEKAVPVIDGGLAQQREPALLWCRAIAHLLAGQRREGMVSLRVAMLEGPQMGILVQELAPALLNDPEVADLLSRL
jgi:tetratricopeptide (TPR) repeat protein